MVAAIIAGNGVGDTGVLFAVRPRSHSHIADVGAQNICGSHGPDRYGGDHNRRTAGRALHQHIDCARRRPLACSLWRGVCHGRSGNCGSAGADDCAVSHHRRQAHALVAQIVAAVIGAVFVIGLQITAIFSAGNLSRLAALQSDWMSVPDSDSAFWWPARAVLGDYTALVAVFASGIAALGLAIAIFSRRFGEHAIAAAGVSSTAVRQRRWVHAFRRRSPRRTLRHKEWTLLQRDPWLVSQTLMQILYLLPPALLLWVTFRKGHDAFVVLIPVIVMAAGQLAGGLGWLSISGEDAPDLVSTAPIAGNRILLAEIEAVIGMVALGFSPMIVFLAFDSPFAAAVCGLGIILAAAAATMIQLCFRVQARRSHFRRRQTSSRIATFAEAFSSIAWAATSALAAAGLWQAVGPAAIAVGILAGVWLISPSRN